MDQIFCRGMMSFLKSDNIENSRIELKGIVLPVPSNQIKVTFIIILVKCGWIMGGGGGGGAKGMLAPLANYWGGGKSPPPPPPPSPLPTPMYTCHVLGLLISKTISILNSQNPYSRTLAENSYLISRITLTQSLYPYHYIQGFGWFV